MCVIAHTMRIAVLGTGPIGSTFALNLARAGHDVTAIARGKRLEQLQAAQGIVTVDGERAAVKVSPELDPAVPFDLVLVTVLATGVGAVLPALKASAAKTVMFMFNTFEALAPLREAVGSARFAFGFPAVLATLPEGKLQAQIFSRGQVTISTDAAWATLFTEAGIYTEVQADMESWLRTHAVMIAAISSVAILAYARGGGITGAEARAHALALREGFALVRRLGNTLTPSAMALLAGAPLPVVSALLWGASRVKAVRLLGAIGPAEPRALIDVMCAAAPEHTALLRAIRP
jgi:2-dehydropantoate 2-reductase